MTDPAAIDPLRVKAESERVVVSLGGKVCDWLPWIEIEQPRESGEVAARALVMHAMLQLHLEAPVDVISAWIHDNGLEGSLCASERAILSRDDDSLTEQELIWAGGLIPELPVTEPVGDILASLLPNLQINEGPGQVSASVPSPPRTGALFHAGPLLPRTLVRRRRTFA
jgi:hypothetical protein